MKTLRLLLFTALTLLGLIAFIGGGLFGVFQTSWGKEQLVEFIESTINSTLNGPTLSVGDLTGFLPRHIRFSDISLSDSSQTLFSLDSLNLHLNPWALLEGEVQIHSLDLVSPRVTIRQDADSIWNILSLLPNTSSDVDTSSNELPLSLSLERWSVHDGNIGIFPRYLPFDTLHISQLHSEGSFFFSNDSLQTSLKDFSLIGNSELWHDPLKLTFSGFSTDSSVALSQLMIEVGETVLTSTGRAEPLNPLSATLDLALQPFQTGDFKPLSKQFPPTPITAHLKGTLKENILNTALTLSSPEIHSVALSFETDIKRQELFDFSCTIQEADFKTWVPKGTPRTYLGYLETHFSGNISFKNPEAGKGNITFLATDIEYDTLSVQRFESSLQWLSESLRGNFVSELWGGSISSTFQVEQLFTLPNWQSTVTLSELAFPDSTLNLSTLNGTISGDGKGIENLNARIEFRNIGVSTYVAERWTSQLSRKGDIFRIQSEIKDESGQVSLDAIVNPVLHNMSFKGGIYDVNLGKLLGLQEFSSEINAGFTGKGYLHSLRDSDGLVSIVFEPSKINGLPIDTLSLTVSLVNGILTSKDFTLKSALADGKASAHFSLLQPRSLDNTLKYDISIKQLYPLAPLFSADTLAAQGDLIGVLQPEGTGLKFENTLFLKNVQYNSIAFGNIRSVTRATIGDSLTFETNTDLIDPVFNSLKFQDLNFYSSGGGDTTAIRGKMNVNANFTQKTRTSISGTFFHSSDSTDVLLDKYNFQGSRRVFTLKRPAQLCVTNSLALCDTLTLQSEDGASFSVFIKKQGNTFRLGSTLKDIDLGSLYMTFFDQIPLRTKTSGNINALFADQSLTLISDLTSLNNKIGPLRFDSIRVQSLVEEDWASLILSISDDNKAWLNLDAEVPLLFDPNKNPTLSKQPIYVYLNIDNYPLTDIGNYLDSLGYGNISGALSSRVELAGSSEIPNIEGFIGIDDLKIGSVLFKKNRIDLEYDRRDPTLNLNGYIRTGKEALREVASVSGKIPLDLDLTELKNLKPKENPKVQFNLETSNFDLALFNDVADNTFVNRINGLMDINLDIGGTVNEPNYKGYILINDGKFDLVRQGIMLREITTRVNFNTNSVELKSFSLKSNKGTASASGNIELKNGLPEELSLSLNAQDLMVSNSRDIKANISSTLTLEGNKQKSSLSGIVTLNSSDIYLDNFGERTVEDVRLESETPTPPLIETWLNNLTSTTKIVINRNNWIRNREYPELEIEHNGDLDLIKEKNGEFQVFGTVETVRGYARQFSKKFDMEEGKLTFSGAPENPALSIRTRYTLRNPDDITIWYIVEGTVQKPTFRFESDPVMNNDNIVSYTLFGRPFSALMGWQQGITNNSSGTGGNAVSDAAVGVLLDRIEGYATEKIGIDVIEIDNTNTSTGSFTSILAGKYVSDRVFVAISQQLGGTDPVSQVMIEYMIRRNLEIILTQSTDERSGIDLRWRYRY